MIPGDFDDLSELKDLLGTQKLEKTKFDISKLKNWCEILKHPFYELTPFILQIIKHQIELKA